MPVPVAPPIMAPDWLNTELIEPELVSWPIELLLLMPKPELPLIVPLLLSEPIRPLLLMPLLPPEIRPVLVSVVIVPELAMPVLPLIVPPLELDSELIDPVPLLLMP